MVLAYYPSIDRIKRVVCANMADAQARFRDIVADFRKMYGTDNAERSRVRQGLSFRSGCTRRHIRVRLTLK